LLYLDGGYCATFRLASFLAFFILFLYNAPTRAKETRREEEMINAGITPITIER
jgi:hypothetical protein